MQQPGAMFSVMPSFPPTNITTEQIQKYLDENKKLILAILDNQNLGKLAECAQYQAQLQKNLMYLAAIADAQPQSAAMPPQLSPHPSMQQGGFYMQQQHPQAVAMAQQHSQTPPGGVFPQRPPFNNTPHSMQDLHLQIPNQAQMAAMRPVGPTNGTTAHPQHNEHTNLGPTSNPGSNKQQDKVQPDGGAAADVAARGGGDGEEAK